NLRMQAHLRAVADAADGNSWRKELRAAASGKDKARLKNLAADGRAKEQTPAVLVLTGAERKASGLAAEAVGFLQEAQSRHQADFWITQDLGFALLEGNRPGEAVGYLRAAAALRPTSAGVYVNLGSALSQQGDLAGAAFCYGRAAELAPHYAE